MPQAIRLRPSEYSVLRLRALGLTNKEVAHRLGLSEATTKNHMFAIYKSLGVTNITSALLSVGWLRPPE